MLTALLLLAGCGPKETWLELRFDHVLDGADLALAEPLETRYGQQVRFDHVRYWVSNVSLAGPDGTWEDPDSYYLVELTPDRTRDLVELAVPTGTWQTLTFHVGVDPGPNAHLDRMAGELQPGIGMDWGWDTGYKFFRTEGTFEEGDASGMFSMHVGTDALYKALTADLIEPVALARRNDRATVTVEADLNHLFAGIELAETPEILGGTVDSVAGKVASNYGRMFAIRAGDTRVPMTASSPNLAPGGDDGDVPTDGTPPSLTHAVLDLPAALWCEPVPGRPASDERACVTPFHLGGGDATEDAGWLTFVTGASAPVRAAAAGVVDEVRFLAHSDLTHSDQFLVTTRAHHDSAFWLEYRNVKDVTVAPGDAVQPGDTLGVAGDYWDASVGAISLGVRREQELLQRLCPTRYADATVADAWAAALATSNETWPEHAHADVCEAEALVCAGSSCAAPADFVAVDGDVDAGRRVYASSCASCHGPDGEGDIGPPLCSGPGCPCLDCSDQDTLAARIESDMPPEGYCDPECAANTAAFILYTFTLP